MIDAFSQRLMHGDLTFDHEGNPIIIKKIKLEELPKIENKIKIKEYFIDESTFEKYEAEKQKE